MIQRLIILIALFVSGCTFKPFQPPTMTYEDWLDDKHSEFEVKKALLECGYPSPFADYPSRYHYNTKEFYEKSKETFTDNTYIENYKCMLKAGFVNTRKQSFYCNDSDGLPCVKDPKCPQTPPACDLPLSQIPDRSIKKRLESDFCKKYPKADVCQP